MTKTFRSNPPGWSALTPAERVNVNRVCERHGLALATARGIDALHRAGDLDGLQLATAALARDVKDHKARLVAALLASRSARRASA